MCGFLYLNSIRLFSIWPMPPSGWFLGSTDGQYYFNNLIEVFGILFAIGIVILSFDYHHRDVRARVFEIMESKPANNLELVVGRIFGSLILLLLPILLFFLIASCYEVVAQLFDSLSRFGTLPMSVVPQLFWNIVPSFLLCSALVSCLAIFLRIRLLVVIVAIGALLTYAFFFFRLPQGLQSVFTLFPGGYHLHSDLAPIHNAASILVNRFAILLVSFALFALVAAFLRRTQPGRVYYAASGGVCLTAGVLCVIGLYSSFFLTENRRNDWVEAHAVQHVESFPNIRHIEGSIDLYPGRNLSIDLTLTLALPKENPTDAVVLSLNPGYRALKLWIDGEEISSQNFSHGLLKIPTSELPHDEHKVRVVAKGKPNENFAYLDQARDLKKQVLPGVENLGTKSYVFHPNFVALVPGVNWYPISGSSLNESLLESRPRDLFTVDVSVSVPKPWTVAMVGDRKVDHAQNRTTYQFNTTAPTPEMALIAANFVSRSTTIGGVDFELLLSKKHQRNLNVLAPYVNELEDWIAENLKNARQLAFEYPYGTFYIVEVPSTLRIFGGGWRMDSVLHPPGMMLLRETAFPTAHFDLALQINQFDETLDGDVVLEKLIQYFEDDLQGGNPYTGFSRNFVNHRTSPTGRGSTALDYLIERLSTQLITERDCLFVPSLWEYGMVSDSTVTVVNVAGQARVGPATAGRKRVAVLPSSWEELEKTSLFDLELVRKPIPSFRALLTKTDVLVQLMLEQYGTEELANFLNRLTTDFQGKSYTIADFYDTAKVSSIDLHKWFQGWFEATTLPGYMIANPRITKIRSSTPEQYQTTFVIHNTETVPGFIRVLSSEDARANFTHHLGDIRTSEAIFLGGRESVRISIQSEDPLAGVEIDPYLALNRTYFRVHLPRYDDESIETASEEPFLSFIEWVPPESSAVVVDDLDPGFSIQGQSISESRDFSNPFTTVFPIAEEDLDLGLPVYAHALPPPGLWTRKYDAKSYGHYRRTHAVIEEGTQATSARFVATLPHEGEWKLDYFVPEIAFLMLRPEDTIVAVRGVRTPRYYRAEGMSEPDEPEERYVLTIKDGDEEGTQEFDITQAKVGWNDIGTFHLDSTEVEVLVSDFAGHEDIKVFADAIRWTPVVPIDIGQEKESAQRR